MHGTDLPRGRAPLAEVVFELHWELEPLPGTPPSGPLPGPARDPHYKLLVGSLYENAKSSYPEPEQLPAASAPDEFVPHIVQHRFRATPAGYPLIQVGPGVFTVNEVGVGYSWKTHKPRILSAVQLIRESYAGVLTPTKVQLRYINAVPFDASRDDVVGFLRDNLKVSIAYPTDALDDDHVDRRAKTLLLQTEHELHHPDGLFSAIFGTGESSGLPSLVWQSQIQSTGPDLKLDEIDGWLEFAHQVARKWFFALIDGKLENEFRSE